MPFTDDQRTNKNYTDDLAPIMMMLVSCLNVDIKLIDSYRRQNDVTQASSLASYPTQNVSDVMTILLAMIMMTMGVADKI